MMEQLPNTLGTRTAFEGPVFRVRIDELRYSDGSTHRCDVVEHAATFGVIALNAIREIILVRQYRHPARRMLWEIPAGTADGGEAPLVGAARELAEETGFRAGRTRLLCSLFMTPGFCDELMHFVVAEDLVAGSQSLDEDERIEVAAFSLERARNLVEAGEIADVKTLLALQWIASGGGELVDFARR